MELVRHHRVRGFLKDDPARSALPSVRGGDMIAPLVALMRL
jgi:hypothetical protein